MHAAIVCDGKELETYDVKQEGTSSLIAFVASEAGKQFKITYSNSLGDFDLRISVHVDGRELNTLCLPAGSSGEFLGPYKSAYSILPLKFQELQLVDPDLEDAPVAPEMGTIEIKCYRCQRRGYTNLANDVVHEDLYLGRVSERSKKAGWHHVATGDETPIPRRPDLVLVDYIDQPTGLPYASIKVFYRPRELLRAQGIIPANDVGRQGSPIHEKKRAREGGSPGPSRSRPKLNSVKSEEPSRARAQRMQALQAELDVLKADEQSGTSVKCELRSPSPIVVKNPGEVVDLTLDD